MIPERLRGLPLRRGTDGFSIAEANSLRSRVVGLARMPELPPGWGLHIPRCRSVHTFGMRFDLDLVFLGPNAEPVRVVRGVRPRRVVVCASARSVVELAAGGADRYLALL
jgi:hypothetical protein